MKQKITLFLLFACSVIFAHAQTNVALKPQKTATASSGDANFAIDADMGSQWKAATTNSTEFIKIDLGVDRNISNVAITWEAAKAATFTVTFITDAGVTLTSKTINGTNPEELVDGTVNSFPVSATARYVQIDCETPSTGYAYSIYNIEITDDAPNPVATASSEIGANMAANLAIDGNSTGTRWESEHNVAIDNNQWLTVDLGATYDISEVKILWEAAKAADFDIGFSENNTDWTTVKSVTGNSSLETNYLFTSKSARYVRINCLKKTEEFSPYGYSIFSLEVYNVLGTLPVSLISFDTKLQTNGQVALNWSTASESNNDHFIVEKSTDGIAFITIAQVASKNSDSNARLNYNQIDVAPSNGINYYRLTQVNLNGTSKVLGVKSQQVNIKTANSILYPNPLQDNKFNLNLANQQDGQVAVGITNLSGKSVYQGNVNVASGTATVNIATQLVSGLYLVNIEGQTFRLIVE